MKAPCKDCEKRQLGCHSKCKEYLAYAEEREKLRQAKNSYYLGRVPPKKKGGRR